MHRYPDGDELERGPAVPHDVADRLACDVDHVTATRTPGHHGDGDCENPGTAAATDRKAKSAGGEEPGIRYGRRRRHPTKATWRFLIERDQCCQVRGCGQRHHLQPHHIKHDAHDGLTVVVNLVNRQSHRRPVIGDRGPAGQVRRRRLRRVGQSRRTLRRDFPRRRGCDNRPDRR